MSNTLEQPAVVDFEVLLLLGEDLGNDKELKKKQSESESLFEKSLRPSSTGVHLKREEWEQGSQECWYHEDALQLWHACTEAFHAHWLRMRADTPASSSESSTSTGSTTMQVSLKESQMLVSITAQCILKAEKERKEKKEKKEKQEKKEKKEKQEKKEKHEKHEKHHEKKEKKQETTARTTKQDETLNHGTREALEESQASSSTSKNDHKKKSKKKEETKQKKHGISERKPRTPAEGFPQIVVYAVGKRPGELLLRQVGVLKARFPRSFLTLLSQTVSSSASLRYDLCHEGANMVTGDPSALCAVYARVLKCVVDSQSVAAKVGRLGHSKQKLLFRCPYCGLDGLSATALWIHCPLYHINVPNRSTRNIPCPVCKRCPAHSLQVHIRNGHSLGLALHDNEYNRPTVPFAAFALVVCRRAQDNRFLMVQEFASIGYWLPGGRVDATEPLWDAAVRETREEAGIDVRLTRLLRVEYGSGRLRVVFLAEPIDEAQPCKTVPDYESAGAVWVTVSELDRLPLRSHEPVVWFRYVAAGKPTYPLSVLTSEGELPY